MYVEPSSPGNLVSCRLSVVGVNGLHAPLLIAMGWAQSTLLRLTRSRQMTDVGSSLPPSGSQRPYYAQSSSTRSRTRTPPRSPRTRFQNSRRARPLSRLKFDGRSSSIAKSNSNAHSSKPKSSVCDGLLSLARRLLPDPRTSQHHPPRLRRAQRRRRRRHGSPLHPLPLHFLRLRCTHLRGSLPLAPRAVHLIVGHQACAAQPPPPMLPLRTRTRRTSAVPRRLPCLPNNRDRRWRTSCTARHPLLYLDP